MADPKKPEKPGPPLDALIDLLGKSYKSEGRTVDELKQLMRSAPFRYTSRPPCPTFAGMTPDPPVPGQPLVISFNADVPDLRYCLSVSDLAMAQSKSYGPFCVDVPAGTPNPVSITIPAQARAFDPPVPMPPLEDVIKNGHDFAVNLYAAFGRIPFGCIQVLLVTTSEDPLKKALFAALNARALFPFGTIPPAAK